MRKVNISLVGKECMPIYVLIEHTQPDMVVLVHSAQTREEAKQVKQECGRCLMPTASASQSF